MAYQDRGSGPPHFDEENYKMWQRRMSSFLRGKEQILWDVMGNTTYFHPVNSLAPGSRDRTSLNPGVSRANHPDQKHDRYKLTAQR
jgi:hypothetical protein